MSLFIHCGTIIIIIESIIIIIACNKQLYHVELSSIGARSTDRRNRHPDTTSIGWALCRQNLNTYQNCSVSVCGRLNHVVSDAIFSAEMFTSGSIVVDGEGVCSLAFPLNILRLWDGFPYKHSIQSVF